MPAVIARCGLIPDLKRHRERTLRECAFVRGSYRAAADPVVQAIAWIRQQPRFGSCAGESCAAVVDGLVGGPPYASGISIWREARRRQGRIDHIEEGTQLVHAIEGLVYRGWDPYREGEEWDEEEAGLGAPDAGDDLSDELFAHDTHDEHMVRYRIGGVGADRLDAVDAALETGLGVVIGTGTTSRYWDFTGDPSKEDTIIGTDAMGGETGGHAQRIAGRSHRIGRRIYLVQNSWSVWWGGCYLPDGLWQAGCCWADESVLGAAWDVWAIGPKE
jgi:hypothetical protein